ncbi:MAG: RAMP superfamily CRISPR-associated protein [Ktedonobacteraceae bacterium]
MMRDYMNYEIQGALKLIEDLGRQENQIEEAKRARDRQKREDAERRAQSIRESLLKQLPPAVAYEFLDGTKSADAVSLRTVWQERNRRVDCLQELTSSWKEGSEYFRSNFASPRIDLTLLPTYSFAIQFTFALAQPYISRDEQTFYIIDNPVRKDKIFGLPYIASTSWKGSLRSALWHLDHKEEDEPIRHLFGNEKGVEEQEKLRSGRLSFYPTFFTLKSLEIINPQDRKLRSGSNPIPFESVPKGSEGTFTLLYIPFDLIGEEEGKTRTQMTDELKLVVTGLQAMFQLYGFGAKTSSGFGLAREDIKGTLSIKGKEQQEAFKSFSKLVSTTGNVEW